VPPPTNPDGTQEGPRVPMLIVSPYAKPGYTDTTSTTFEGILAYVEQNFGLSPLGVNDARVYPFTKAFNYAQAPLRPVRMVDRLLPPSARRIHLTPALLNDPS
jgi:phospholipase C